MNPALCNCWTRRPSSLSKASNTASRCSTTSTMHSGGCSDASHAMMPCALCRGPPWPHAPAPSLSGRSLSSTRARSWTRLLPCHHGSDSGPLYFRACPWRHPPPPYAAPVYQPHNSSSPLPYPQVRHDGSFPHPVLRRIISEYAENHGASIECHVVHP